MAVKDREETRNMRWKVHDTAQLITGLSVRKVGTGKADSEERAREKDVVVLVVGCPVVHYCYKILEYFVFFFSHPIFSSLFFLVLPPC